MVYEVERKFWLSDTAGIKALLDAVGVEWKSPVEQCDTYYNHPARDFGVTDEAFRLRQVGSKNWMTYKGPKLDKTTKTRREIELSLSQGSEAGRQFDEIFAVLGFKKVLEVRKTRTPGEIEIDGFDCEIAWDEVQDLGTFLELEIVAEENRIEYAKMALGKLAVKLQLTMEERRSYLEMLLEKMHVQKA